MAKKKTSLKQQRQAMNNITARSIVATLVKVVHEIHHNKIPSFVMLHRSEKEASLAAVVMQASFLETWMNFADEHWSLGLPTKKPPVHPGAKPRSAGLEYKLNAMLTQAKKKIPTLKLLRPERTAVIARMNQSAKWVSRCVRIRNKVAHGQPYAATKENGRYQQSISKAMQQMSLQDLQDMVEHIGYFTNFCEIMLDPKQPVKRLDIRKWILSDTIRVPIKPKR